MRTAIKLAVVCVAALVAAAGKAQACDGTNVNFIDTIDHMFPDGGGVFNGSILSGTDESWMVFAATAGDNIVVNYANTSGGSKIASVFIDIGDGIIQVGDVMNISNWNNNNLGLGNPLQNVVGFMDQGGNGVFSGSPRSHTFVAPISGQYGIFMASCNSFSSGSGNFTVALTGPSHCFVINAISDQFNVVNDGTTANLAVLANDECTSDTPISVVELPGDLLPDRGGSAITDGTKVIYGPAAGFIGFEEFTYTAQDAGLDGGDDPPAVDQDTASVLVNVLEDLIPDAVDDMATTLQSQATIIDVLGNDSLGNPPNTVGIETAPANGSAIVQADDTIRYSPNFNSFGEDSFEYRLTDANGDSDVATVTVGVFFVRGQVPIDIMPTDDGNNVNLRAGPGAGVSVAILSVGEFFEAPNLIDPLSLKFGPRQGNIFGSPQVRDVDGDGDDDLIVKFLIQQAGIACGDTQASLFGRTFDSQSISGSDAINTFNCPRVRKRH